MLQPILTLPSGTELKGGSPGSAVKSLTLHTAVNAGQEFTIGSAFSDYIEAEIWADHGWGCPDVLPTGRCREPHQGGRFLC